MEKLGIRPERLQLEYISAAEGQKFARMMRELDHLLHQVTPEEVAETMRILEQGPKGVPLPRRATEAGAAAAAALAATPA